MLLVRAQEKTDTTHTVMALVEGIMWSFLLDWVMRAQLFFFPLLRQQSTHQSCQSLSRSVRWAVQDRACRFTTQSVLRVAPGLFPDHTVWSSQSSNCSQKRQQISPGGTSVSVLPGESFDPLEMVLQKVLAAHFDLPTRGATGSVLPVCEIAAGMRSSLCSSLKAEVYYLNELNLKWSAGSLSLWFPSFFQVHYYRAEPLFCC